MGKIHDIPSHVLITWPRPNFANPVTQGNAVIVVATVFPVLSLIIVALRVYTRCVIKRFFGLDDALIVLALVLKQDSNALAPLIFSEGFRCYPLRPGRCGLHQI
jgi:hypothetical protein